MLFADVSEQPIGPIFRGQAAQEMLFTEVLEQPIGPSSEPKQTKNNVIFRRFGTTYRSYLQGSNSLEKSS
jgi:hypothetical protein